MKLSESFKSLSSWWCVKALAHFFL